MRDNDPSKQKKRGPGRAWLIAYLCLLALFTLGVRELGWTSREERPSRTENRMLSAAPEPGLENILSGEFMTQTEEWLSDGFPGRDRVVAVSRRLMGLFAYRAGDELDVGPGDATLAEDVTQEAPLPAETPEPREEAAGGAPGPPAEQEPEGPEEEGPPPDNEGAGLYFIRSDGQRVAQETYSPALIRTLADNLNVYRGLLGEDGTVHMIYVPVSNAARYLSPDGQYTGWESDLAEVLQPLVDEGVFIYDAEEILSETMFEEYDYLTSDHHWTPLGASRFVRRVLDNQGLVFNGYYEYLYRLESEYRTDNNYDRRQLMDIAPARNNVQVMVPVVPTRGWKLTRLTQREEREYLLEVNPGSYPNYYLYLRGLLGGWRTYETGYHTGRNALILGDSYITAFLPYLTPYYDNITVGDLRDGRYQAWESGGGIADYMATYGADDVYFLTCTWTPLDGTFLTRRIIDYLYK